MRARGRLLAATAAAAVLAAGCGAGSQGTGTQAATPAPTATQPPPPSRVETVKGLGGGGFDPTEIYRREAPGVVTVISVFGDQRGLGSGFVLNGNGEVATNAHVVTNGGGGAAGGGPLRRAQAVYVKFADANEVSARIVGTDPNSDVALLRIDPAGLTLRPLPLGSSARLAVGSPVAAIGSPFGEPQSLSVGVISATDRTIDSLTDFQISDAIQTDAAVNHGNSGGPLVDGDGRVLGINSQISSSSGGGEGVGFAVPVDTVKRSLDQLRADGRVAYAYIGVSSVALYPQLARRFGLPVGRGAYVQTVNPGSPAARAGLRGGTRTARFQSQPFRIGGDIITRVDATAIREESDLSRAIARRRPGETVSLEAWRGGARRTVRLTLGQRPASVPGARP